jgi:hypothetical protein
MLAVGGVCRWHGMHPSDFSAALGAIAGHMWCRAANVEFAGAAGSHEDIHAMIWTLSE